MWDRIRALFGGKPPPPPATPAPHPAAQGPLSSMGQPSPVAGVIAAADNPYGVELLDLRPITLGMRSVSSDQQQALTAMSWRSDDGTSFVGTTVADAATVPLDLTYVAPEGPLDGRWFGPTAMEEKWALFHYDSRLYVIRSWTRHLTMVVTTERRGDCVAFTTLQITPGFFASEELAVRSLDFIMKSHVIEEAVPAPLPEGIGADIAGWYGLKFFGRLALWGTSVDLRRHRVDHPFRVDSPLHLAFQSSDLEKLRARVQAASDAELRQQARYHGFTAIHWAALFGYLDIVTALLARGIPVDLRDEFQMSPLHSISSNQNATAAMRRLLLSSGADIRARDIQSATPLHLAAATGTLETVTFLLTNGADVNARADGDKSVLSVAIGSGRVEIVRALLDAGADVHAPAEGSAPLALAEKRGMQEIAALLRERGA